MRLAQALRRRHRAGRSTDRWFQETYKPWRKKARRALLIVTPPMLAFILGLGVLATGRWEFSIGLAVGAGICFFASVDDSPPEWIERKRRGRDAERRTAKKLIELEREGWTSAHDISARWGNFDHLVVGPAGAFLLETKDFTGTAEVRAGRLVVNRGEDARDSWSPTTPIEKRAAGAALEARNRMRAGTGLRWVQPVVVLWSDFPQGQAELGGAHLVHGDLLVEWLRGQRQRLEGAALARAADYVRNMEAYEIAQERAAQAA